MLDMPALIVMPEDAPASKMAATRSYGAQVVTYDRFTEDREAISRRLADERGMTLIPPFNHRDVIAGQGTAAKELFEEVPDLDYLFVCLGGGGLLSGSLLAAGQLAPRCKVYGVEPQAGDDARQSLRAGRIVQIPTPHTIADGAQTQSIGDITFAIIREHVEDILAVADEHLVQAMRFYAERKKIVVEPTGALSLAGALHGGVALSGARVGILISGGNVDGALRALSARLNRPWRRTQNTGALFPEENHEYSAPDRPPAGPTQAHADAPQGSQHQQLPPHAGRAVHADGLRDHA